MEIGGFGDGVLVLVECAAAYRDGRVEIIDRIEVPVDEWLVDKRPKMLGGLQFRTVGGLVDQSDAIWDGQIFRAVPARIVEHENDDAVAPSGGLPGERPEQFGKERLIDPVRDVPDGLSARRRDEGSDVKPLVAVMTERDRPLADR